MSATCDLLLPPAALATLHFDFQYRHRNMAITLTFTFTAKSTSLSGLSQAVGIVCGSDVQWKKVRWREAFFHLREWTGVEIDVTCTGRSIYRWRPL